ncbi:aldose 1-epimerase family protein [uncultured Draconibacterium sp.]|uniref:aldose 1-epimerase family protein n=1 Tax=uncultured Draconibacterium sp. TaxID=1573823 RepID=UPI0029C77E29|nr:aldose 1-epimerase family protein [uncultured Draconibacterium sp.]
MDLNEKLKYIGNINQLWGVRPYELSDGWARKMRAFDVNAGCGLLYTVLPDRGMDISLASFKGNNLVYLTCNGETSPTYYEPEGIGWLHTFSGGLLTTCGLTHLGPPSLDDGENLGLHGRYSTIPARQVADCSSWVGDEYHIKLRGIIEEGRLFGNKLRLEREILSVVGQNSIEITDTITNFGNKPSPYTILYHMNLGYPLLSEKSELEIKPLDTSPRDESALSGLNDFRQFIEPQENYNEQVFFHKMKGNQDGFTQASLLNIELGIRLNIIFNVNQLPFLTEWKMMGYGEYVLGLEPCNVFVKSRKLLREEGELPYLKPQEFVTNKVVISIEELKG